MTDYEEALTMMSNSVETILTPLVEDETIAELVIGPKSRGAPLLPYIKCLYGDAECDTTTLGSLGNREVWMIPLMVGSTVKELENPQTGMILASSLVSKARNLLLTNRQLNLPSIVRKVDSYKIQNVPYPFGKKKTLYGAGTILNIYFIIDNQPMED